MRRSAFAASMVVAAFGAAVAWAQPATRLSATRPAQVWSSAADKCGACHPLERVQWEASRHAQEGVRCVSCHGGDGSSLEERVAHGPRFAGRPRRADIPRLCASCHASEEKMRPYGLRADQYGLYLTSGHGRRLAAGDTRVAVCSDCHGAHEIRPPEDPASPVFSLNIPRTCGNCHGDSALMVRERHRPDAYREYLGSVHAGALLERANRQAPTCISCHGVHSASPPGASDIDKVCGQCHTAERRYFAAGPHLEGLARARLPECVSCHSHHDIKPAEPRRLASLCADCHAAGSAQAATGARLWATYQAAAAQIDKAEALIVRADAVPISTDDYHARLEEARTSLREALPAAHSVDEPAVAGFTSRAQSIAADVASEIHAKLGNLQARKIGLVVFWFYLVLTVLILRRFQSQAVRKD